MTLRTPVGHVLQALFIESRSADDGTGFVWRFILPLYVPTRHVHFTIGGERLSGPDGQVWDFNRGETVALLKRVVVGVALPYFETTATEGGLREELFQIAARASSNPHCLEALAYTLIRQNEHSRAVEIIERLRTTQEAGRPWEREIAERAALIGLLLARSPSEAYAQLEQWENGTVEALKLQNCRAPSQPMMNEA
jgi:hypothetical protein